MQTWVPVRAGSPSGRSCGSRGGSPAAGSPAGEGAEGLSAAGRGAGVCPTPGCGKRGCSVAPVGNTVRFGGHSTLVCNPDLWRQQRVETEAGDLEKPQSQCIPEKENKSLCCAGLPRPWPGEL